MAKQIEQITESIPGQYLGIQVPKYEFFQVELQQKSIYKRVIKTGEQRQRTDDFQIRIIRNGVADSSHQEISNNLKVLFGMSFVAYDYQKHIITILIATQGTRSLKSKNSQIF